MISSRSRRWCPSAACSRKGPPPPGSHRGSCRRSSAAIPRTKEASPRAHPRSSARSLLGSSSATSLEQRYQEDAHRGQVENVLRPRVHRAPHLDHLECPEQIASPFHVGHHDYPVSDGLLDPEA